MSAEVKSQRADHAVAKRVKLRLRFINWIDSICAPRDFAELEIDWWIRKEKARRRRQRFTQLIKRLLPKFRRARKRRQPAGQ